MCCEKLNSLNKVQVHNLGEERSVGLLQYEINERGKKNNLHLEN